jgi:hypothetical protein
MMEQRMARGNCFYCDIRFGRDPIARDGRSIDHIVPIAVGGIKIASNEIYACKLCNNARGTMLAEKYLRLVLSRGRKEAAEYAFTHRRNSRRSQHAWAKEVKAKKGAGWRIEAIIEEHRLALFACRQPSGLFHTLTESQKAAVLAYDGPTISGDRTKLPRAHARDKDSPSHADVIV